jgi:hypothetical protein
MSFFYQGMLAIQGTQPKTCYNRFISQVPKYYKLFCSIFDPWIIGFKSYYKYKIDGQEILEEFEKILGTYKSNSL